jgi:hypothetical protein
MQLLLLIGGSEQLRMFEKRNGLTVNGNALILLGLSDEFKTQDTHTDHN